MARVIDAKCRQCRREGEKLFLKGEKCFTDKCAVERRAYAPGQHGQKSGMRLSDYGKQLREKQKMRHTYGLLERQFRNTYHDAAQAKGVTGERLLQLLESRLDNITYRMGFGASRGEARQVVRHNGVLVNGKRVNIASYRVKAGDVVSVRERSRHMALVLEALQSSERDTPDYITVDGKGMAATFVRMPELAEVPYPVKMEPNLVIEFYAS